MSLSIRALPRRWRHLVLLVLMLTGVFATTLFESEVVNAEAVVAQSSEPADGAVLLEAPTAIKVTFNQKIGATATTVMTCNKNFFPTVASILSADLQSLTVDLTTTPLTAGTCNFRWSVIGITETSVASDTFSFEIKPTSETTTAPAAAGPASTTAGTPAAESDDGSGSSNLGGPLGLARLISMLTVGTLLGSLLLITVAWPEGVEYILTIRFIRLTWIAALASTIVMVVCLTAQATGSGFAGSLSPTKWTEIRDTTPGIAALVRVLFVAATGWVALRPDRAIDPTTQLAALAIPAVAVATMGFSRTGGDLQLIGYAAGIGHALAMSVWLGGLILLARVVLAGPGEDDLVHAVRGFSRRMANPALLITVVTGVIQLWRMDAGHLWDTTHGRLVLFKVLPVIALIVIGTATRQFVHAQMSRAEVMSTPLAAKLRRAVSIEAVFGVVILGITAWMLSTQPGNLVAGPRSSDDFAVQLQFDDADATLDAKLSLDPARVGTNEVLLEIRKPAEGISSITVEFSPPASEVNAHPVTMTITELTGTGAALLPRAGGLPLDAAGAWSVKVTVTAAAGVFTQSQVLDVRSNGTTEQVSIPSIEQPPVTAVPTSSTITTVIPG